MKERLVLSYHKLANPDDAAALGDNDFYVVVPCDLTIVYVCVSPDTDDADLTVDINDDGTGAIEAISAAVKATPGSWTSTYFGGAETPVRVAADSELSFDVNTADAATTVGVWIWALTSGAY